MKAHWTLDPAVTFLNHGSFGACPRPVIDAQRRLQAEMEREPVEFLARRLEGRLTAARDHVARFLGADPANLTFVPNATAGVNTVLHSLRWRAGDEIVIADQAYNAVKQAVRHIGDRYGTYAREATIPFPLTSPDEITAAFAAALTEHTRLVIVDHVASATALIFPVEAIVALARARGIPVLIDGAHGPGLLPLDLEALGADFYTGNLHKWVCAPKGAAILHVAPRWHDALHPLSISHAYGAGLQPEFGWTGTADPSPWLAAPDAIDFFEALGWEQVRASNHALVQRGRVVIAEALGVDLPHPDDPRLYGPMAVIPFPRGGRPDELTADLYARHRIEVPFTTYDARVWVRISGQLYNAPEDYERLAAALR